MAPVFVIILALWGLFLLTGLALLFGRNRKAGAALVLGWLLWTTAGELPCAFQLQSARPGSLNLCSPVIALGPFAFAFYQR